MATFPTVNTTINYYLPAHKGGGDTVMRVGTAYDKLRKHDAQRIQVHDFRGREAEFDLDTHGFQLVSHRSAENEFVDEERIRDIVYPEIVELLKRVTGATDVHPFSHIIRRHQYKSGVEDAKKQASPDGLVKGANPAMFAHIDQSYTGAHEVLCDNMEDGETLTKTRYAIINVWRPIRIPVPREPLAVCDARSVPDDDLVELQAVLPQKGASTYGDVSKGQGFKIWNVKHNPLHKWYYASQLRTDEVLMIKCFDSKRDGRARRSPHSAFQIEGQDEKAPARESIEVRCLVFWEDQSQE